MSNFHKLTHKPAIQHVAFLASVITFIANPMLAHAQNAPAIPKPSQSINLINPGATPINASSGLDYPELLVVPKASERLGSEANLERNQHLRFWAYQASALVTFFTAMQIHSTLDDEIAAGRLAEKKNTSLVTHAIPATWLVGTLALNFIYKPYKASQRRVNGMPKDSPRDLLAKERAAEEALDEAARFGKTLSWFSFASEFATSIILVSTASDIRDGQTKSTSHALLGVSVLASALPLIFPGPWVAVKNTQESYKKKIYGPIARVGLLSVPSENGMNRTYNPGLTLNLSF